jgi:hypothetical protein
MVATRRQEAKSPIFRIGLIACFVVLTLIAGKTRKPLPFKPSWGSIIAMFAAVA